jgi:hypothetical protein
VRCGHEQKVAARHVGRLQVNDRTDISVEIHEGPFPLVVRIERWQSNTTIRYGHRKMSCPASHPWAQLFGGQLDPHWAIEATSRF